MRYFWLFIKGVRDSVTKREREFLSLLVIINLWVMCVLLINLYSFRYTSWESYYGWAFLETSAFPEISETFDENIWKKIINWIWSAILAVIQIVLKKIGYIFIEICAFIRDVFVFIFGTNKVPYVWGWGKDEDEGYWRTRKYMSTGSWIFFGFFCVCLLAYWVYKSDT